MFGMDAIFNNPSLVRMAAKAAGVQAARLDYDPVAGELWASLRLKGRVHQVKLPLGRTFTIDEILALLFPDTDKPAAGAERIRQRTEEKAAIGQSPP